jgi:meiotically up-regulated gene 157 (Mug157) protein
MYIRHDPYANAFRIDDTYKFSVQQKKMGRHDLISTWNYELDSGCYYIRMLYYSWKQSKNAKHAESVLRLPSVQQAVEIMVDVWTAEQRHELDVVPTGPLLDCANCGKPYRYPGLPRNGKGSPTNATAGLTWTGFRPSDDECKYHYLVPANMFAVVALQYVVELAQPQQQLWNNPALAAKAQTLANQIQQGIQEHAIVEHPKHGKIYAYEVDGLGNYFFMDDANVPSLLSIPYLGYD